MKIYDRIIAGVIWLRKFTPFHPNNFKEDIVTSREMIQWGNFSIGYNIYPNLFNIFVRYAPTAKSLLRKKINLIISNVPKEIKIQRTTYENNYTNTVENLLTNLCRDYIMFEKSFAIWVGYDDSGIIDEIKRINLETVRYLQRDEEKYPHTNAEHMLSILNDSNEPGEIYYPYAPDEVLKQIEQEKKDKGADYDGFPGQILFYNSADDQQYPDCIFEPLMSILLSNAATSTMVMSYMGNADICKTYRKKAGATGTDTANSMLGFGKLNSVWAVEGDGGSMGMMTLSSDGSQFYNTGVKAAGQTEDINVHSDEAISNYIQTTDFPKFIDEITKIDERSAREICLALDLPYEYVYKMSSGIMNQDNRATMISEINSLLETDRQTIERVINEVLEHSKFSWRLSIRAIGEGQEDVKEATENVTE